MGFGKMNCFCEIISNAPVRDAEGFTVNTDHVLASIRAYREDRHGNVTWANRAAFSAASALFRFRVIPGLTVDPSMFIVCEDGRYRINSVENVRGRGMYYEVLAEKLEPTAR
jgi:hypothetical protein